MPDPSRLVATLTAYWSSATLVAAIDLGVFRVTGRRWRSARAIARGCGADHDATRRLCDALVADGWMRAGERGYALTRDAAVLLDPASPSSMPGIRTFFHGPQMLGAFARLPGAVRRGRVTGTRVAWARFARVTWPLRREVAAPVAARLRQLGLGDGRVLDIGSGASPLGLWLLEQSPTATLTAVDQAPVLRVARAYAKAAGVGARLTTVAGDATRVAWPRADLVVMMNAIDYFTAAGQRALLRKARRSLAPGGALVIVGPMLDSRRRSPAHAVAYDVMLLALGGGTASTTAGLRHQLRQAGFRRITGMPGGDALLAYV